MKNQHILTAVKALERQLSKYEIARDKSLSDAAKHSADAQNYEQLITDIKEDINSLQTRAGA